jgi:hypothetical protein
MSRVGAMLLRRMIDPKTLQLFGIMAPIALFQRMILSKNSATFWDHASSRFIQRMI